MSGVFGLGEVRTEQIDRTWLESANYGYFAGGINPTPNEVCTIDRLDFSSETVSLPASSLSLERYGLATVSSSNYGYFAGGGGGSGYSTSSSTQGAGSPDGTGGAAGVIGSSNTPGNSGVANTGGGGGGAGTPGPGQPYDTAGGAGAGGTLIIAYDI